MRLGICQLGERVNGVDEATNSNLLSSAIQPFVHVSKHPVKRRIAAGFSLKQPFVDPLTYRFTACSPTFVALTDTISD